MHLGKASLPWQGTRWNNSPPDPIVVLGIGTAILIIADASLMRLQQYLILTWKTQ